MLFIAVLGCFRGEYGQVGTWSRYCWLVRYRQISWSRWLFGAVLGCFRGEYGQVGTWSRYCWPVHDRQRSWSRWLFSAVLGCLGMFSWRIRPGRDLVERLLAGPVPADKLVKMAVFSGFRVF